MLISCLLLLGSCLAVAGAAAGAAGLAYIQGALRATVNATPPQFITAADKALREMNIDVQQSASDTADGHINGRTANNRDVTITATQNAQGGSDISIRVGTFGDENLSREIYNKTVQKL